MDHIEVSKGAPLEIIKVTFCGSMIHPDGHIPTLGD